ncbi:MAG TPA: hypothetical protein VF585_08065, partial [Chthoniobacterales bacterium]
MPNPVPMLKKDSGFFHWLRHPHIRKSLIVVAVVLVVAYAAAVIGLNRYLSSEKFRARLAQKTGQALQARSGYLPFTWRGYSAYSEGFEGKGLPGRSLRELRASQIWARINLWEIWRREVQITRLTVDHLQVVFGEAGMPKLTQDLKQPPKKEEPVSEKSTLNVDIRELIVNRTDLWWGDDAKSGGGLCDVVAQAWPHGKNLVVQGHKGTFQQAGFPKAEIETFALYYAKPVLQINRGALRMGDEGTVEVSGKFEFTKPGLMDLNLQFRRCDIAPFLPEEKRSTFVGTFAGDTRIQKELGEESKPNASGWLESKNGVLSGIPALEKMAAFTGEDRFRKLKVHQLKASYTWKSAQVKVEDLVFESSELMRV